MTSVAVAMMFIGGCAHETGSWECDDATRSVAGWPAFDAGTAVMSGTGDYAVMFTVVNRDVIPTNERFSLVMYPFRESDTAYVPAADVQMRVDAAMPHHGHGMNVVPTVTRQDDGGFLVQGMLFHMPGRWEIYFDITRNGVTERAQTEVVLE